MANARSATVKRANVKNLHEKAVRDLEAQYKLVMDKSADGVFIYLDDEHKACNAKLAEMFGYTKKAWEAKSPFLENFVVEADQQAVSENYWRNNLKARTVGSVTFLGVRKDGSTLKVHQTTFPISYKRRLFVIGFVHKAGR